MPNASAACCTDSTKISLTSATRTVTPASVARATPIGHGASPTSACCTLPNNSRCVFEREQRAQPVGDDEQHREAHAQLLAERHAGGVGMRNRRRNQQRDRGQEEQSRLHAGADAVEFLLVVLESAQQKRRTQDEQRVGDNRAGNGRLHQRVLPGAQGGQRDDQFRQVSERGVQQAADRIAGLGGHGHGGEAQQHGQRHDGQDGQHEEQRVRVVRELLGPRTPRARRPAARAACCRWMSLSSCFMGRPRRQQQARNAGCYW